ncbi:MAG: hypothetical protein H5U22_01795 [Rhizobium sp.]|nr:hypothetical protein [Rhizobium sp.]
MLRPLLKSLFADVASHGSNPENGAWYDRAALIDLDFDNGRFRFNGANYTSLAAVVAAMGGTAAGNVLSIGPYDPGFAALYTSDFSAGIDGWLEVANAANGSIAATGGNLVATVTGSYSIAKSVTTNRRLAALVSATMLTRNGLTAPALASGSASNLATNGTASIQLGTAPSTKTIVAGAGSATLFVGASMGGTGDLSLNAVSAKEVYPYAGFTFGELSYEIDFTAPAAASGNKVLLQWGCADEDHRVRLVYDGTTNVRQITTAGATEGSNIDLGTVAVSTRHTVRGSCKQDLMHANIDGGPVTADTSASFPPLGQFWVGRSVTGETFDGSIHRVKVYSSAKADPNALIDPLQAFRIFGDSTADGVGSATDWYQVLTAAYTPDRAYAKNAQGGESSAQMLARVAADSAVYKTWPTILMDRPNTGESSATWSANTKAAVALRDSPRWLVWPPVQDVPDTAIANIAEVQALLLSDAFYAGHTLDATDQAAYIAAMADGATRSDGTHDSDAGAVVRANAIKAWLDAKGW